MRTLALPLLLLTACPSAKDHEPGDTGDAGDSGTLGSGADMPAYCDETSRTPVTDLAAVPDGFTASPADVLSSTEGPWIGTFTAVSGATTPITLSMQRPADGAVEAVTFTLVDPSSDDTGPAMGAPDVGDCPPRYDIALDVTLATDDGQLNESFSTTLQIAEPSAGHWSTSLTTLGGTAQPTDIVPAEWDHFALALEAYAQDDAWLGSGTWQASNDTATAGGADSAGTSTGTVAASGMTEGLGGWTTTRPSALTTR